MSQGPQPLARVADPAALDRSTGARARLRIEVPHDWAKAGCKLQVQSPRLLTCDRCDGGGCDSCRRSGGLRAPSLKQARVIHMSLPSGLTQAACIRLSQPFEMSPDETVIEVLLVEVRLSQAPSKNVQRLVEPLAWRPPAGKLRIHPAALATLVLGLLAIALAAVLL